MRYGSHLFIGLQPTSLQGAYERESGVGVRNVSERDGTNVKFSYESDAVRSQNNYYWAIYEKRHLGLLSGWMNGVFGCVILPQVTGKGPPAAAVSIDGKLIGHSLQASRFCPTVRTSDRLVDWSTDWLTDRPTDWLTDRPTDCLIDWLTDRSTDWPTNCPTYRLTDLLNERPTNWLIGRPIGWQAALHIYFHNRSTSSAWTTSSLKIEVICCSETLVTTYKYLHIRTSCRFCLNTF